VTENGILLLDAVRYIPYDRISRTHSHYQDKQDFRGIDLELDDGSTVHLSVESGHGKLRDAFAVSSFLGHMLRRLKQAHTAYRPVPT
jgi:ABC-type microcin C transport system duplicated ATPase subunit YejF